MVKVKVLIDFAKKKAIHSGIKILRLDSRADRYKVRAVYEKQGFICVAEKALFGVYETAFYECKLY